MNRRELLGVAAAAPLAAIPFPAEGSAITAPRLLARIERKFKCVEGPARSYFEGVTPSGKFGRAVYQSFVNGMATTCGQEVDGLDSEAQVLDALWRAFEAYAMGKKGKLYWRKRPHLYTSTPTEAMHGLGLIEVSQGKWQTPEVVQDGLDYRAKTPTEWGHPSTKYFARMRLIITDVMPFVEEEIDGPYKVDRPSGEILCRGIDPRSSTGRTRLSR